MENLLTKSIKVKPKDFYRSHLNIVNAILPEDKKLTKPELSLLSVVIAYSNDYFKENPFCTEARRAIRKELEISHQTLTNRINTLLDKSILYVKDEVIKVQESILINDTVLKYAIQITKIDEE